MDQLTRREALQKGGIAVGGLTLGGTALAGTATAKNGGTGFIAESAYKDEDFVIFKEIETSRDLQVECEANSRTRTYTKYHVAWQDTGSTAFIWVKGNGPIEVDPTVVYRQNKARDCGEISLPSGPIDPTSKKVTFTQKRP